MCAWHAGHRREMKVVQVGRLIGPVFATELCSAGVIGGGSQWHCHQCAVVYCHCNRLSVQVGAHLSVQPLPCQFGILVAPHGVIAREAAVPHGRCQSLRRFCLGGHPMFEEILSYHPQVKSRRVGFAVLVQRSSGGGTAKIRGGHKRTSWHAHHVLCALTNLTRLNFARGAH